jgi:hypothetical protein
VPLQSKLLTPDGKALYLFSNDLVWGCRYYARQARQASSEYLRLVANMSCVFLGGSYVEARLNELTANVTAVAGEPPTPLPFWQVLHGRRRDLGFKDKWDLIASVSKGQQWDASKEPFQSYDDIVSLRNELVHYKADYGDMSEPTVARMRGLLRRFKGAGFGYPDASWVTVLLTADELGEWVSKTVDSFDMTFDHLLSGKEMTDMDRTMYALRNASQDPFREMWF